MVRLLQSQNFLQHGDGVDEGCLESEAGGNQKQEVEQSRDVTEQRLNTIEKNCRELDWRIGGMAYLVSKVVLVFIFLVFVFLH